ncbi:MAG: hypothetical protein WCL39_10560, partial [Armatimonadota bacterium]
GIIVSVEDRECIFYVCHGCCMTPSFNLFSVISAKAEIPSDGRRGAACSATTVDLRLRRDNAARN